MSYTVNIVYVRDTVPDLLPYVNTLLRFSQCNFRLISNACREEEKELLRSYCNAEYRCSFYEMNTGQMLPHHEVLNHILYLDDTPYFIFLDSDVMVTGPFLDVWLQKLEIYDAIFTGLPVWQLEESAFLPRNYQIMDGRYLRDHRGELLGVSYGAAYRKDALKAFMRQSELSFSWYYFEDLSDTYKSYLKNRGFEKYYYDTGKLLNIVWRYHGAKMEYFDSPELIHIGGVSTLVSGNMKGIKKAYNTVRLLFPAVFRAWVKIVRSGGKVKFKEALEMENMVRKKQSFKDKYIDHSERD